MSVLQAPAFFQDSNAGFDQDVANDGYAWWYVDALSDDGQHGITIIAFIGSVFSPYYAWARRKAPADPLNHCALNVALYGKQKRWAMTERPKTSVERSTDSFTIGPSSLSWDGSALTISVDEITVPIPSRIRGTIRVRPAAITDTAFTLNANGNHTWWPIAPAARVEVALDHPKMCWQGDGYLDMNTGDSPLEKGFVNWEWSRAAMQNGTAVLYETKNRGGGCTALALKFDPAGTMTQFDAAPTMPLKRSGWRVARSIRSEGRDARVIKTLTDAPFYARSLLSARLFGEQVELMHESLSLDRFSSPLVQAMLPFRMPRARR